MNENTQERVKGPELVKYFLEEYSAAIREKRPVPSEIVSFDELLLNTLSKMLKLFRSKLDDEYKIETWEEGHLLANSVAKEINGLSDYLLKGQREFRERPEKFHLKNFDERLSEAYEERKAEKTNGPSFSEYYSELKQVPISGTYWAIKSVVVQRRILRKYLRARFGAFWKKPRIRRPRRPLEFSEWFAKNNPEGCTYKIEDIPAQFRRFLSFLNYQKHLQQYTEDRLKSLDSTFIIWRTAIFMSFDSLTKLHGRGGFSVHDFTADILRGLEPAMEELDFVIHATTITAKREYSLDYEEDLLNLSALVASSLSITLNRNLAKTLASSPKRSRDALLEKIPGSVLLAIDDTTDPGAKLRNKVANIVSEELPLFEKHNARLHRQIRDRSSQSSDLISALSNGNVENVSLENLRSDTEQDFTLLEEARIDLAKIMRKAKLTPNEKDVFLLKIEGYTEEEIATKLHKKIGTIKSFFFRAKHKMRAIQLK